MGKLEKSKDVIKAADNLSLGISMVVAMVIGVGIGIGLQKLFDKPALIWVGIVLGIAAAMLNVYKAYKEQVASYDELKNDPRYKDQKFDDKDEDDA